MSEAIERLKLLLGQNDERKQEDAPAGDSERVAELEARIVELEAERTEFLALFERAADVLEERFPEGESDDGDGEEGEVEEAAAEEPEAEAEPQAEAQTDSTKVEAPVSAAAGGGAQAGTPQGKRQRQRQPRAGASRQARRATPANVDSMTIEELAKFGNEVLDPADKAGRSV